MWKCAGGLWSDDSFPFYNLVTTNKFGNLRDPQRRKEFCLTQKLDYNNLVIAEQIHENKVAIVDEKYKGRQIPGIDGLVTARVGIMLAIFTADCLPVFIGDRKKTVVALLHAGWRGLEKKIISQGINILRSNFNIDQKDLVASVGPHIKKCCYETGDEVKRVFGVGLSEKKVDLTDIAKKQLEECGLTQISVNPCCTCCGNQFYSYRKTKTSDRIMSLIRI